MAATVRPQQLRTDLPMDNFETIELLILAGLAGFILFRLRSVLGRRTGNERPPQPRPGFGQKPQPLPREAEAGAAEKVEGAPLAPPPRKPAFDIPADTPLAAGLTRIQLADRNFDPAAFISGARAAHELIITSFARGNRAALRPLLSEAVYDAFEGVIRAREQKNQKAETVIVAERETKLAEAGMDGTTAEVTVRFVTEIISNVRDAEGKIVEGSAEAVRKVTDLWTFARDTRSSDPNWKLVATESVN